MRLMLLGQQSLFGVTDVWNIKYSTLRAKCVVMEFV